MSFESKFIHTLMNSSLQINHDNIFKLLPPSIEYSPSAAENLIYLKSAGTMTFLDKFHYTQKNFHSYCMIYTLSGYGILQRNKEAYSISPGTLCFIDCRFEYTLRSPAPWECQMLFFDGYPVSYYYDEFIKFPFPVITLPKNSSIPSLINKIIGQKFIHNDLINNKLLTDILTYLLTTNKNSSEFTSNIPQYLSQMKEDFDKNYHMHFSLEETADYYQVNKYRICRDFKKYFATTPLNYLNGVRLDHARELLKSTNLTVTEIGYQVGFENTNHFIQLFKKDSGVTPAVFRKHNML